MRLVALAVSLLGITAGAAQATGLPVVVVPGLTLADLPRLEERGAVGLLVPGAGPETNRAVALASLERGAVRNSLRGGAPGGPRLVEARTGPLAAAPGIYLGLPEGGAQPNDRRYPVVVVGEGWSGVLASSTTRIDGLVSVADLAPAAR
ncbi:MAG TPA: hypothetical protein VM204_07440, partial [Gaiellaceae bacterium]|nr:hypothetical protein [Gaiellaceae bacterium]